MKTKILLPLLLAPLMPGCQPSGPTQKELFDLRTQCIAMAKGDAAHYDATRNRCFTTNVENYLGQGTTFILSLEDAQSRDVLMVCVFQPKEPQSSCEQAADKNVGRKEAENFFKSRMGEDAVPFPATKP